MKDKVVRIFISYSKQDQDYLNDLKRHLTPLEKEGRCEVFTDENIVPGEAWDESIRKALERSHIILLLVSADFVSSWFAHREMQNAIERYRRGQAMIIPVIVRPADWQSLPVNRYYTLPKDGIPISSWEEKYADSPIQKSLSKDNQRSKDEIWTTEVIQPLNDLISKLLKGDFQLTEPLKKTAPKASKQNTALLFLKEKAETLIREGKVAEASDVLQEMIVALDSSKSGNGPLLEDMIILRSQHNQLQKQLHLALISPEEYSRASARITYSLLETLKRLNLFLSTTPAA